MSYFDVWKNKMCNRGNSVSDSLAREGREHVMRNFKDSPSYRFAKLNKVDLTSNDIDIRIVNIDKSVNEKKFKLLPLSKVNIGDYIKYEDKTYIVDEFEDNDISPFVKGTKCRQLLKWKDEKGVIHEYSCDLSNNSYGSKVNLSNNFISEIDNKVDIKVQANQFTKAIKPNTRFIFNSSEDDIYELINISTAINLHQLKFTCEKCVMIAEDDLENNLAYNSSSNTEEPPLTNYKIVGNPQIKVNEIQQYVVDTSGTISWTLDNTSNCSVKTISSNRCEVKALVRDELNVLTAIKDRVPIAKLNIETMR